MRGSNDGESIQSASALGTMERQRHSETTDENNGQGQTSNWALPSV